MTFIGLVRYAQLVFSGCIDWYLQLSAIHTDSCSWFDQLISTGKYVLVVIYWSNCYIPINVPQKLICNRWLLFKRKEAWKSLRREMNWMDMTIKGGSYEPVYLQLYGSNHLHMNTLQIPCIHRQNMRLLFFFLFLIIRLFFT